MVDSKFFVYFVTLSSFVSLLLFAHQRALKIFSSVLTLPEVNKKNKYNLCWIFENF